MTGVEVNDGMEPLRDLIAVDHRGVLEFFTAGLAEVSETPVDRTELLYNASVLAHFAQVSTQAQDEMPTPATLGAVFDHFVLDVTLTTDARMMEIAGAQCLLLTGFFERQMRRRHSIGWYVQLGERFFGRAADLEKSSPKSKLLRAIGRGFDEWRRRHQRLSQELQEQAYILRPPRPGEWLGR